MTIKELKNELSRFDENLEVVVQEFDGVMTTVDRVDFFKPSTWLPENGSYDTQEVVLITGKAYKSRLK